MRTTSWRGWRKLAAVASCTLLALPCALVASSLAAAPTATLAIAAEGEASITEVSAAADQEMVANETPAAAEAAPTSVADAATTVAPSATASSVEYVDAHGKTQVADDCAPASTIPDKQYVISGWYYVDRDTTIDYRFKVNKEAHLILGNGATLTATYGIAVLPGAKLTIYAEAGAGDGKLVADNSKPSCFGAGIGGDLYDPCGTITICGGTIEAAGGEGAAGIGGAYAAHSSSEDTPCGDITIYGGNVTATGGSRGAGIGSGRENRAGSVAIRGGTVVATAGEDAFAIGNGYNTYGKTTLSLYDRAAVRVGESSDSLGYAQIFEDGAAYRERKIDQIAASACATIEPCDHSDASARTPVLVHDSHHTYVCAACGEVLDDEPHSYNYQGLCTMCHTTGGSVEYLDEHGKTAVLPANTPEKSSYDTLEHFTRDREDQVLDQGWHVIHGKRISPTSRRSARS